MSTVEQALQEHSSLREERDTLQELLRSRNEQIAGLAAENALLRVSLDKAASERDYYMRFTSEMMAGMNSAVMVMRDLYNRARDAARSRPQGSGEDDGASAADLPTVKNGPAPAEPIDKIEVR